MLDGLFPQQRALVMSEAPKLVTCTGRRGGKTHALVARAMRAAARYPRRTIPVFERTLTCQSSRVFFKALQDANERYSLGVKFHHSLFQATLSNGSEILIVGADTVEAADKARGEAYPEAIVDEAGTFRPHILEYLLNDVLAAALFDHGGTLVLSGTPAPRHGGPFYEACEGNLRHLYERHHWTALENPMLPYDRPGMPAYTQAERDALRASWFAAELAAAPKGWGQREWLGLWVVDNDRMAYHVGGHNHVGVILPPDLGTHPERYVWGLGLDLGFNDPCAFVVVARDRATGTIYVVESYEQAGLIPSAVAAHVERLRARYRFSYIVADTGGYGKGPVAEMMSGRYGIPIIAANKRGKEAHRTFVNGDLASGKVLISESTNRDLLHDLQGLRLNEDGEEDERDANHLPDAFLYILTHLAGVDRGLGDADAATPYSDAWLAKLERECERMAGERATQVALEPGLEALPWA